MMEEQRTNWTIWIVLGAIVVLLIGCAMGAMAGGLVGYMAGRSAAARVQPPPGPAPLHRIPAPEMPDTLPMHGALVVEVIPDSPAEQAGIRIGDVIMAVEDRALDEGHTLADAVTQYDPGEEIQLHIYREGRRGVAQVTLGRHPELGGETAWLGVGYRNLSEEPMVPDIPRRFERPG
jgi:membrane-associated protease RseP (regulator of RpoE activity)